MSYDPWIGSLVVGGTSGNYGTVKILVDEQAGPAANLLVTVEIAAGGLDPGAFEVEVFTNLNRRDFAKPFEPLDQSGNPASSYWMGLRMQAAGSAHANHVFRLELPATKCGAYRLTTRYRRAGTGGWWWHNDFAPFPGAALQRDCAIVVSPAKAAQVRLYEANALTVEAIRGGSYENRSTLDDFLPQHDFDGFNPFQLGHVREELGFNALWLMPVFPITRWRWDLEQWQWAGNDHPGSPYSTRDYWSINPWLADDGTSGRAMQLFVQLVSEADRAGLDVFIDAAFNHAGRDVVYGAGAIELGLCSPSEQDSWIREVRPTWCTRGTEFLDGVAIPHYRERASDGFSCAIWAPADRLNEHVWDDANVDWFFGDYSSLGPKAWGARDPEGKPVRVDDRRGGAEDERDLYFTDLGGDQETVRLWEYFAHILPYWLGRTSNQLAGIRADFAQGLPNQLWEYIINRCRKVRWDFVFLAEVLDPDTVQYRLNRVFDVLTTKDHHLYRDSNLTAPQIIGSLEAEARILGPGALVMHNGTSHDEAGNSDRWAMVGRYAVAAGIYGVPMVFMGQPLGLYDKLPFRQSWADMYHAWIAPDAERERVADMYRRINAARDAAPELRSPARYFLNQQGGGIHDTIFAVARWISDGGIDSVVLVFVNLLIDRPNAAVFALPRSIRLAGLYTACNLVAQDPTASVWPAPRSAEDIGEAGIYVQFEYPNEVQFLRLNRHTS
jgi:hypothetical protein